MKYVDEGGGIRTLITEKHPFMRVENYFIDSLLYQNSLEAAENLSPEDPDSSNEVDANPEQKEEYLWELNPLITSIDNLDFNNTANDEGEWFINEDLNLTYFFALTSDYLPSNISTDIDSDHVSAIHTLTSLHASIRSFFMVLERASEAHGSFFKVPVKYEGQKSILFGRVESKLITRKSLKDGSESQNSFIMGRSRTV